jgi:transcriptional regulator with XRE-family HTH domain
MLMYGKLNKLKEILVSQGITQKDFAVKLGKNEHTISNMCINKSQPHVKDLYKVEELLKVDVYDLLVLKRTKRIG